MTPSETVVLTRYVKALCPQQQIDEYTPDAWHDLLGDLLLGECREGAKRVAQRQPFVSPSEIRAEVRKARKDRADRQLEDPPDADPDDVAAYLEALREGRAKAHDGTEKPRPVGELLDGRFKALPRGDRDD